MTRARRPAPGDANPLGASYAHVLLAEDAIVNGMLKGAPPLAAANPPLPKGARADPAGLAADPSGTERGSYRMQDRLVWPVIVAVLIAIAIIAAIIFVV